MNHATTFSGIGDNGGKDNQKQKLGAIYTVCVAAMKTSEILVHKLTIARASKIVLCIMFSWDQVGCLLVAYN